MRTDLRTRTIGVCSWIVVLMAWPGAGFADSVEFRRGDVSPPLAISPASPTIFDVVHFTTPLDGNVHGNVCAAAAALGGYPVLSRDDARFTIDLVYDGNVPSICPLIYDPVVGAEGNFGLLPVGDWTFRDPHNNSIQFAVVPEPSGAMLLSGWFLFLLPWLRLRRSSSAEG